MMYYFVALQHILNIYWSLSLLMHGLYRIVLMARAELFKQELSIGSKVRVSRLLNKVRALELQFRVN